MLGQSGPGNNGNKGVLRIPQSSSITGTSPSDCLVSYTGHSLGGSYPSVEVQSVYSTAPVDWASVCVYVCMCVCVCVCIYIYILSASYSEIKYLKPKGCKPKMH